MKLLLSYILQHKKALALAVVLATINRVFQLLDPQLFRLIIDRYATRANEMDATTFAYGVGGLLLATVGVALVSRIAKNLQDYYTNVVSQRVGTNMYSYSVNHAFSLPYAVFEDQRSGELLQKLQKARLDAQNVIQGAIDTVFLSIIGIIFVMVYAFWLHWSIGLVFALILPTLGTATVILSRKIRQAQKAVVKETASLSGSTTETIRNVALVKSLGLQEQEITRLNAVNEVILQLELKKIRHIRTFSFIQGTLINTLRSALLFLMLWLIFQSIITVGEFFTMLFYSFFIFTPLAELGTVAAQYQEARASSEELKDIMDKESEPKPAKPKRVKKLRQLVFEKVSFKYGAGTGEAVKDITLQVTAGQTVAFAGPSGSGKTTMMKLILGLYKPTGGTIRFNDIDVHDLDYDDFRRRIGLVAQDAQLFAGTIRENLQFVKPDASEADCLRVMGAAQAMNIIERGDKGLDTKIGEGGLKLSGGERQRLAIARALLRDPELIIFDEATSSLDSLTEKEITKTIQHIEELHPELVTILVAHRLSTISHADTIYVLEKGAIVESGSHEELLARKGLYAAMWREQQS